METPQALSLQPYYGGSHRAFMESWQRYSEFEWRTIDLPPRHWKWRMRHAAWHMADVANQLWDQGKRWQVNFCTDMLNLAEFKGLVRPAIAKLPTVIYFHENQFAYPNQATQDRDLHFSITNFSSALAADSIWFNSAFNRDSMTRELRKLCEQWPDFPPDQQLNRFIDNSKVIHPGVEVAEEMRTDSAPEEEPHLIWAARWEHDKGPDILLQLLRLLKQQQFKFRLSVIGQSFRNIPNEFDQIKSEFSDQLVHWGFQPNRQQYRKALASADLFISTAKHEFFGLAACEAISAGLFPILPNRLAYPELLNELTAEARSIFLYNELPEAVKQIQNATERWGQFDKLNLAEQFQNRFGEHQQSKLLDQSLREVMQLDRSQD